LKLLGSNTEQNKVLFLVTFTTSRSAVAALDKTRMVKWTLGKTFI